MKLVTATLLAVFAMPLALASAGCSHNETTTTTPAGPSSKVKGMPVLDARNQATYQQYLQSNTRMSPAQKEAQEKQLQMESTPANGTH